jgi:homoserine kinase type II
MAVFTPLTEADIRTFVAEHDVGTLTAFDGIAAGSENTNYRVTTDQGLHILTVFEGRVAPERLPAFMAYTAHLYSRGVPCPTALPRRDGQPLGQLKGKPAALIQFMPGRDVTSPTPAQCREAGIWLARLHRGGIRFQPTWQNPYGLNRLRHMQAGFAETARGHAVWAPVFERLHFETVYLTAVWALSPHLPQLARGMIHADYFPDNVFFDGNDLSAIIDFYFAGEDTLIYDLAIALLAWGFAPDGTPLPAHLDALRTGYEEERPLDPVESANLPLELRRAGVRFLTTRLMDAVQPRGGTHVPKDPMYFVHCLDAVTGKRPCPRALAS